MSSEETHASRPGSWFVLRNVFVSLFIWVLIIDTMPAGISLHKKLKDFVDPILDKTGLWPGTWDLFSPSPKKINTAMSAVIKLENDSLIEWTSPNPRSWNLWEKSRFFRWNEYYDTIRLNDYEEGWPGLADWLARKFEQPGKKVVGVRLYRSWANLDEDSLGKEDPFPFSKRREIFQKEYP